MRLIRFQTPFPARLRVFYWEETCIYNTAEEAMKDMAMRGLRVTVVKPELDREDQTADLANRLRKDWRKQGRDEFEL